MSATYRGVNVSLCAAFVLCLIAVLAAYANDVGSCWLRMRFGKDCLLCGCTRDIADILSGGVSTRNALSGCLLAGFVLEVGWRVVASFASFGRAVVCIDVLVHSAAALILVIMNVGCLIWS